jgi:uncharacterized membrane protein (UPF0136 family)
MRSRKTHPLHAAFTLTTFGSLLLVGGALGYTFKKSNWYFMAGTWSDSVVWWEIGYGMAALAISAYFWRKGLATTTPASSHT